MRKLARLVAIVLISGGAVAGLAALLALPVNALVNRGATSVPDPLPDIFKPLAQPSYIYAADGTLLAVEHAEQNRTPINLDQVPTVVINAVLDTEDSRFFTHGGIDVKSTVRALASDVKSGSNVQGASTITQQLVKTVLNTPEKTLSRKINDAVIANRLEKKYTKRQILQAYLNTVYFGNGAYGIEAASETYFGAAIGKVNAAQATLLGGIIRDPLGYDPILNPHASLLRRNFVLDRMVAQGHLTAAQAVYFKYVPVPTALTLPHGSADTLDNYYVSQVKQILLNQSTTLGNTYSERDDALFNGGLKIYTNLDPRLQGLAEVAVAQTVPKNPQGFTAALASIDPSTGDVKAVVGGPGYDTNNFDLATQAIRPPGSGFKIFTLLASYEAGLGPNDLVNGSGPCALDFPSDHDKFPINNDEGTALGPITITSATAGSVNCAFVRLAHAVGLGKVVEMAHRLGLTQHFDLYPEIVIGQEGTTVLQMAAAYATLADDGVYHKPTFISRIVDRTGKTIYKEDVTGKRVLSPQISQEAVLTLKSVVTSGTGTAAALPDRPVVGKTGTASKNEDAWFNGITPQLATSVWMGNPKAETPMSSSYPGGSNVGGIAVFGGTYPARIWHTYTEAALLGLPAIPFPGPNPFLIPSGKFVDANGNIQSSFTLGPFGASPNGSPFPTTTLFPPPSTPPPTTKHRHRTTTTTT